MHLKQSRFAGNRFVLAMLLSVAAFMLLTGPSCPGSNAQQPAPPPAAATQAQAEPAASAPAMDMKNLTVESLNLADANGNIRASLKMDGDGPGFSFFDANGKPRSHISLDGNGNPFIDLYNSKGDILSSYWVENDQPFLTYQDKDGKTVTIIPKDTVAPVRTTTSSSGAVAKPAAGTAATASNNNMTVYVVKGVYHLRTCPKILEKNKRPMVLSDAIANNFVPCAQCLGGQAPSASRTSQGGAVTADPGTGGSAAAPGATNNPTVYVLNDRPFYHLRNCQVLKNKGGHPMALSDAKANGYGPCSKCGAPI